MEFSLQDLSEADAAEASAVVKLSFDRFVAPDWSAAACAHFTSDSTPLALAAKIKDAFHAAGARAAGRMVGFLMMRSPAKLNVLFVHPDFQRRGIGRALWERARIRVEAAQPQIQTVELNASPFAVPFYRSVGFVPISAEYSREGFRATHMACWLPARSWGAEIPPPG